MKHRIAVFAENSSFGGISSYCLQLCEALINSGELVWLFIPLEQRVANHFLLDQARKKKIPVALLYVKSSFDFSMMIQIHRYISELRITTLHTNGYRFDTIMRLYRLCFFSKLKHIVCVHTALPNSASNILQKIYNKIDNLGHIFNVYTIVVSEYTKLYIQKRSFINKSKVFTIYNGLNYSPIVTLKPLNKIVISFVGRICREKGIDFLCQIISIFCENTSKDINVVFEICGTGGEEDKILNLVSSYPDKVVFKGFVSDVSKQLSRSHILIMTSMVETFGLVALEATSQNVVVIGTRVGGLPEVIEDNVTGVLIDYGDANLYVKKLKELVYDSSLRDLLLSNAQKCLMDKFLISNSILKYISLLSSIKS